MDEENRKIYLFGADAQGEFDLEDILEEYRDGQPESDETEPESLLDRSKRIVMENLGDDCCSVGFASLEDVIEDAVAEAYPEPEPELEPELEPEPEPEPVVFSEEEEELIAELQREAERAEAYALSDDDGQTEYASASVADAEDAPSGEAPSLAEASEETPSKRRENRSSGEKSGRERFMSPLVAVMALIALHRSQRPKKEEARDSEPMGEVPEMEPGKAARRYAALAQHLKFRGKIATVLSLIMIYLSYAAGSVLPLTGALKSNPRVLALMLMILELSVIMAGLDIFTEGILSLFRRKPGARTLVSVSCLFSLVDAAVLALADVGELGLPFCAASAVSLTLAMWGACCNCSGLKTGLRVLASGKNLYTVTGEKGITLDHVALLKSRSSVKGFVRRSEARDYSEIVFGVLAPILLVAAVVLGALASLGHGAPKSFFHCVSALTAASAAFSATISFAIPFAVGARCLAANGAAVAGWAGLKDIGSSRHVVITDSDMFPRGTVDVGNIRILEGAFVDKVISYTASVITASGCGLATPFAELLKRNGYTLSRVENFEPHDGGGMTAMVNGDNVCIGNTGFMNLMGIRVPRKINTKNSIYTAINGSLVGIFTMEYRATGSVQEALVTLLHSNLEPIFAIRDFNITPLMIKTKFRMPTDGFKFPAYAERYRISGAEPDEASRVAAVIAREGMNPLVDTAERGRRLFSGIRIGTLISAAGCVFGLLMMFLLCWTQSFDVTTVSSVITFMLLWLIPTAVIVWGVQR